MQEVTFQIPDWSKEIFVITKFENIVPWAYVIRDLEGEEVFGMFYEEGLQKTNQTEFRIEKAIKIKGAKMDIGN